jgi:RNA polymerase sigma-70 factor (ECF subfamily)
MDELASGTVEVFVLDSRAAATAPDCVVPTASLSIDYSKLRRDVVRAVSRVCPSWLSNQRDDLVQAAMMRVMQIVEKLPSRPEGDAPFASSYLHKVAYSVLVDELRRVTRRQETDLDDEVVDRTAVVVRDPETEAASRQIGAGIRDCLSQLNRDRRLAVTLYLQGHTVPDAARVLDWPAKRTENLVYRGLADLRECLSSKGHRP